MNGPGRHAPAEWAEQAAEAVRWLNHATIDKGSGSTEGYRFPGDVDATLANLQVLVERLPQALEQMTRWLDRQARAGLVRHDAYPVRVSREEAAWWGTSAVTDGLVPALAAARAGLGAVAADLNWARNQSSHLAGFLEDLPDDDAGDGVTSETE